MSGGTVVAYKLTDVDIDRVVTASNVRKFFANKFQTYLARGGLHKADLSSPDLEPTGVTSNGGNSAETSMMKIFDYQAKCGAVYTAIINCSENRNLGVYNRSILLDRYINDLTDTDVMNKLGMSSSSYGEKKVVALCEFADWLPVIALRYDTKFDELRKFLNVEEL